VWKSPPVKGDIGLVFVPESEMFNYVQQGSTNFYAQSIRGAYRAFFDQNIQADFVALEDIGKYRVVYLPYPVMLSSKTVGILKKYVQDGGTLISEGLPAWFGDHGKAGPTQPNYGLGELFGGRETYVEFTPDLLDNLTLEVKGNKIFGRYFLQEYGLHGGQEAGHYANGHIAAVENRFGKGRTLLIGTFPGGGYYLHPSDAGRQFFGGLLKMAGVEPQLRTDNPKIQARLHEGPGGAWLWIVNPERTVETVTVSLPASLSSMHSATGIWARRQLSLAGRKLTATVPARDADVLELR
jgi:beta-galactosidase